MQQLSPKEVKKAVSDDLKFNQRLSRQEAADRLGYTRKESFNNVLNKDDFFPYRLAKKLNDLFGYSIDFLTRGVGCLKKEADEVIIYDGVNEDLFEKDFILKTEEWARLYGGDQVAVFLDLISAWWRAQGYHDPRLDRALIDKLRDVYNDMMRNCRGERPFIGFHPKRTRY